jgi:hypothetical protein
VHRHPVTSLGEVLAITCTATMPSQSAP